MVKKLLLLAFAASSVFSGAFAADGDCSIVIQGSRTFTGNAVMPDVKKVSCGDDEYFPSSFTSIEYGDNINAGENAGSISVGVNTSGGKITVDQKFTINPKEVNVKIDDAQKEKGNPDPKFTWSLENVKNINADTLANFIEELTKVIKLERTNTSEDIVNESGEVIKYAITLDKKVSSQLKTLFPNYDIGVNDGSMIITKTKVTVTAKSATKVYGEDDPKLEYAISGNIKTVDYDKLGKIIPSRVEGENAGTYDINVSVENKETTDYIVETVKGEFVIQPAPVSVVVDDVEKVYGDATPVYTYKVEGLLGDDELKDATFSCKKCLSSGLEPVGDYTVNVTFDEKTNPNYDITVTSGLLTVSPKAVTVTIDDAEKVYGDKDPKFTFTAAGLVGKEVLEGASITRAEGEAVASYKVEVAFEACDKCVNSNYDISVKAGKLAITPKAVTLKADDISKKFGEKDPELTYTVDGLVKIDGVKDELADVVLSREKGENAGTYAITATVKAKSNPNYEVSTTDGVFTIVANDDEIVVTVLGHVDTVEYNGKEQIVKGFDIACNSEAFSLDFIKYTGDSTVSGTDAKKYPMGLSAKDFENTSVNYPNVTFEVSDGSLVITPKSVVVTATSDTITYGDETPTEFVWTTEGLLDGDELDNIHVSLKETGLLAAGKYDLVFDKKNPTNGNYVVSEYVAGTLDVLKKAVTVKVADTSKVYGSPDPETFAYEVTGLLDGDELTGLLVAREPGENVLKTVETNEDSSYRISATFAEDAQVNPNYALKVLQGKFTITPYMEPIKVFILGDVITAKYTGDTITVPRSFDAITYSSEETTLPAECAYTKEYVKFLGEPTISGRMKYLYPMNFRDSMFVNISPNFANVTFVVSKDGTLIINDEGPTSIASLKGTKSLGIASLGRSIQISGSKVGDKFAVLDMHGKTIRKGVVATANFDVSVPTAGIYMVRVGSTTKRIRIK